MKDINNFYNLLISNNVVDSEDLEKLKVQFFENEFDIIYHLKKKHEYLKDLLGKIWGDYNDISYVNLDKTLIMPDIANKLTENEAKKFNAIPLYKGMEITLATSNVHNELILKEIEKTIGEPISVVFAFPDEIEMAIEVQFSSLDNIKELSTSIINNPRLRNVEALTAQDMENIVGDKIVVKFTDEIILWAIKERASDIHIEPFEDIVRIRYRIDGVLQEKIKLDKSMLLPLIARIKVIAGVDIVEKRRPQDGRISYKFLNRKVDIRFSVIPTMHGEKVVLRILGQSIGKDIPDLKKLDFSKSIYSTLKQIIECPNGIFFITGPTGSGKSTTLFSILKEINKPEINITTVEDPIEYKLYGINQVQVNPAINLDFAAALRAFLRQDPDVILIGEIRDVETAKIAAQAALTGHLVLATMHTNNSIQAVTRLIEIGVEPFLVAPSIIGVMAQRLVRKICDHCKESYILTPEEIEQYFIGDKKQEVKFYYGKGCPYCNDTGYYGRIAIHEVFVLDPMTRNLIAKESSILDIQKHATDSGFKSMWHDGIKKVLRGITTIEEVKRVVLAVEE